MDNYTMIEDWVVRRVGLYQASVYGIIKRYSMMRDGVCRASMETMAQHLGVSRGTVWRCVRDLITKGLVIDKTPGAEGVPHILLAVNEADIVVPEQPVTEADTPIPVSESDNGCIAETQPPVSESYTRNSTRNTNRSIPEASASGKQARPRSPGGGSESWAWINLLCEVCKLDVGLSKGKAGSFAKRFRKAGYTLDEIRDFYGDGGWWYKHDFRGKKGEPPTLALIHETIRRAREFRPGDGSPAAEFTTPKMAAWG